ETEAVIDPGSRGVQRGEHVPAVAGIGEQIRHQRADQAGAAMLGADRHPGHTARRDTYALAPRVEFAPHPLPEQPAAVEGTASMESRARPGPAAGVPALWRLVRTVRCVAAGTCVAVVARAATVAGGAECLPRQSPRSSQLLIGRAPDRVVHPVSVTGPWGSRTNPSGRRSAHQPYNGCCALSAGTGPVVWAREY